MQVLANAVADSAPALTVTPVPFIRPELVLRNLEVRLARRALSIHHNRNLAILVPETMEILDVLATYACKYFAESKTQPEIDAWLNAHPIMQFLIQRMHLASYNRENTLYRLEGVMNKMAKL